MQWDYEVGPFVAAAGRHGPAIVAAMADGYYRVEPDLDLPETGAEMWIVWCAANRHPAVWVSIGGGGYFGNADPPAFNPLCAVGLRMTCVDPSGGSRMAGRVPGETRHRELVAGLASFTEPLEIVGMSPPVTLVSNDPTSIGVHYSRLRECVTWLNDFATDHVAWNEDRAWLDNYPWLVRKA